MLMQMQEIGDANNISRYIYTTLKHQILNMELLPGEKMSEMKIAKMLGCSRTPVREAFHQLRLETYLESRPQVGTFVPKIDMQRVEEVRFIRESVEIAVLKYGIEHDMFKAYVAELQDLIDQQEEVYARLEYNEFNRLDMQFHSTFQRAIGKEYVSKYSGDEDIDYARLRFMSIRFENNPHIAIEHHQQILDAVVARDIPRMEKAVSAHLSNLYNVLKTSELNNPDIIL